MNTLNVANLTYTPDAQRIAQQLADELDIALAHVVSTVGLLDEGATVPFIARYRKELTGGLTDEQLRNLEQRLEYLRELEERRKTIIDSIQEQDKLTPPLFEALLAAETKQRLEDLYAPYRRKRRTRAQIAREAGLEPLADTLLENPSVDPEGVATQYVGDESPYDNVKGVLDGARDILAERFAEDADLRSYLRDYLWRHGWLYADVIEGKEDEGRNFRDWFQFREPIQRIPSHRLLAILRGRQQEILRLRLGLDPEQEALEPHPCIVQIARYLKLAIDITQPQGPGEQWLAMVCRWTWRVRLLPSFETEIIGDLNSQAEEEAIRVFAENLRDLLLAAPAGFKNVMGLDPGIRTGVKVAVINRTAKVVDTATVYPFAPRNDVAGSIRQLANLIQKHDVELIAIGNGTASRETEGLVRQLKQEHPHLKFANITISEAGASVYSASELGSQELPDLDVSLRGAVSIARRLQDPLAELVKIEPKAIGVGQYQHDVNQRNLARSLDAVVEDCVNAVGVEVNTASAALLARVSGLTPSLAQNIVDWREQHGAFPHRKALLDVPRFGPKAFEQAAGFLRITNGDNPLDASAVHPEAYPVVEKILQRLNTSAKEIVGQAQALDALQPEDFTDERFGLPTVKDIFKELKRPGRDPRPEFKTAQFKEGVTAITDLHEGMQLEGVISNVANFGAFVDIGVGQDGLVHISELANEFVRDPRDRVRVGQPVKVRVLEIDLERKRISLSMRDPNAEQTPKSRPNPKARQRPNTARKKAGERAPQGAMAEAFAKLKR
ncbi:MAG TPA: Tex family protein [Paenalcaligenes sp.]|nr:Tex family protein [Paenalcaligenes sp.]